MIIGGFIARLLAVIVFITASCFSMFSIAPLAICLSAFVQRAVSAYVTLFVCTHFIFPTVPTYVARRCDYKIFAQPDSKATINGHPNTSNLIRPRELLLPNKDTQCRTSKWPDNAVQVSQRKMRRDPSNEVGRSSSLQALLTNFLRREVSPLRVSFH